MMRTDAIMPRAQRCAAKSSTKWRDGSFILTLLCFVAMSSSLFGQTVVGVLSHPDLRPNALAIDETRNKVFVADSGEAIYVFDGATNAFLGSVATGLFEVDQMVIDESHGKLYAACLCLEERKIAVVDAAADTFIRHITWTPFGAGTFTQLAKDEDLDQIYALFVGGIPPIGFARIEVSTDAVTYVPGISGNLNRVIRVNPATHEVLMSNFQFDTLNVVDGLTLAHTKIPELQGAGLEINWRENKIYVALSQGASAFRVYNRNTDMFSDIPANNEALELAYNPISNRIYSSSEINRIITIIEGASEAFVNLPMLSPTSAPAVRYATNRVYYAGINFVGVLDDSTQLLEFIPLDNSFTGGGVLNEATINQSTGRVYTINDGIRLRFVTVIQDEEKLTRPPVYLGSIGPSLSWEVNVIDPGSKKVADNWNPRLSFPQDHAMAVRPGGGRLYYPFASTFTDGIEVFAGSGADASLGSFSSGGSDPRAIAFLPDGSRFYVTNSGSNNVSVMDVATNALVTTIAVGNRPWGIAATPEGAKVLVANQNSNSVSVINTATNTVSQTIVVGATPWGVALNPSGTKAYVANAGAGTVSVIDISSATVTKTVTVGTAPHWLAITPEGRNVYVSNRGSGSVSVIDAGADEVVTTLTGLVNPEGLAALPEGSEVYVASSTTTGASSYYVINTSSLSVASYPLFATPRQTISVAIADPTSKFAGRVTSANGAINNAVIRALQAGVEKSSTASNAAGDYSIFNLKPGVYDIEVSAPGFISQMLADQAVGIGRTKILDFTLAQPQVSVTFDFPVAAGAWYLISLPVVPADNSVNTLFPGAAGAFGWNFASQSYVQATNLEPEKAYWLLMLQSQTVEVFGEQVQTYTHNYTAQGWDLTGGVFTNSPLIDDPDQSVISMFGWNAATGQYETISPFAVEAKQGYWILVFDTPCTVTAGSVAAASAAKTNTSSEMATFAAKYGLLPPPPPYEMAGGKIAPLPERYCLSQNYPNPFNPETVIEYQLPQPGKVSLKIYNLLGHEIRILIEEEMPAGFHKMKWNGKDDAGRKVETGVYLYKLHVGNFVQTRKTLLLK